MTTLPLPQHLQALQRANEVRFARAELKRQLRTREVTFAQALEDPAAQSMKVFELLCVQYGWGTVRAHRVLREFALGPVSESRRVGALTVRQRRALAWVVER